MYIIQSPQENVHFDSHYFLLYFLCLNLVEGHKKWFQKGFGLQSKHEQNCKYEMVLKNGTL